MTKECGCEECRNTFAATNNRRYCSQLCKERAKGRRRRQVRRVRKARLVLTATHAKRDVAAVRIQNPPTMQVRDCVSCATPIVRTRHGDDGGRLRWWCAKCKEARIRGERRRANGVRGTATAFSLYGLRLDGWHEGNSTRDECGSYQIAMRADPCAYCGTMPECLGDNGHGRVLFTSELDHIQPKRGKDRRQALVSELENLTGACAKCNGRKGTMSLLGFLLARDVMLVGIPEGEAVVLRYRG